MYVCMALIANLMLSLLRFALGLYNYYFYYYWRVDHACRGFICVLFLCMFVCCYMNLLLYSLHY